MRTIFPVLALVGLFSAGGCAPFGVVVPSYIVAPTDVVGTYQVYDSVDSVQQYTQRSDRITLTGGNAQAVNTRIHEIDPWPRNVGNKRIAVNGERMVRAMERYKKARPTPLPTATTSGVGGAAPTGGAATSGP